MNICMYIQGDISYIKKILNDEIVTEKENSLNSNNPVLNEKKNENDTSTNVVHLPTLSPNVMKKHTNINNHEINDNHNSIDLSSVIPSSHNITNTSNSR